MDLTFLAVHSLHCILQNYLAIKLLKYCDYYENVILRNCKSFQLRVSEDFFPENNLLGGSTMTS